MGNQIQSNLITMKFTLERFRMDTRTARAIGFGSCLFFTAALSASDLSGDWEYAGNYLGDISYARVSLKIENGELSGTLNELKLKGTLKDGELTFTATRPAGDPVGDFKGKNQGDTIAGTGEWQGGRKVTWSAKRPIPS